MILGLLALGLQVEIAVHAHSLVVKCRSAVVKSAVFGPNGHHKSG